MTAQMRSKRRLLPKRSVVDIDYISPTAGAQELMYAATPTKEDHQVINELLGKENKERSSQIVLGKPKRKRSSQKEVGWSDFFQQHSIIPGPKLEVARSTQEDNVTQNESIDLLQSNRQESLIQVDSEQMKHTSIILDNTKNENIAHHPTEYIDSLDKTTYIHKIKTKEIVAKERIQPSTETPDVPKPDATDSFKDEDTNHMEPVVVIVETPKKKKKQETGESFMLQPSKTPKRPRSHETIQALRFSGALDWKTEGRDEDPRKQDIGKVRKRQLEKRLNQPIELRRTFHPKSEFIVQ
ncbi:hypothetical protein BY458DRAFT_574706 [Sporodiniella umbellata]|nr:hypothetical protein BY458DRAFT_574706 [Sporodiniella umbellata]